MTKAAIQEMQDLALFEPKMTRSRLKEGVEKGVSIPTWNISPIKRALEVKPPQFVDIPLEDEDDSSDEEYCLDKEDENAEEVKKSFISAPLVNKFCSISQKGVLCDYDVMPVTLSFWSDVDIAGSSPCCARGARPRTPGHSECEEDRFDSPRQVTHCTSAFGLCLKVIEMIGGKIMLLLFKFLVTGTVKCLS
ncbi:unnamed protein product [Oncorhynchus mykiss]|uniref:Uncharacterized protein n=1 Tax=Oncorhynchus mykiss TaxID=8022 RepID=A0A060WK13_ONCMY|nr:unnamed protein product [Oncorhynchus mykiss]